jgi:hypothetical protein
MSHTFTSPQAGENRLAEAQSAYLRSAAHQPIHWYEFGETAFARARELDRPILLDIGAVWCHWCHVIDRESYDDPEIAELINRHFVAIKVDRDQRPDVDARYQQVVASMTGQGGWPLTAFLAWDGRVIYGGTYFPPQAMKRLLTQVARVYEERKEELLAESSTWAQAFAAAGQDEATAPASQSHEVALDEDQVQTFISGVLAASQRAYDAENGGFGTQPKFPHFSTLAFLARQPQENEAARQMLSHTLTQMGRGGMFDQLVGGFHRYSVDDHWHVPHFEKMAYDNAEAMAVYGRAFQQTGNAFFEEIAKRTARWVCNTLSHPTETRFYASQDADIDLEDDGDYFTWSLDEVTHTAGSEMGAQIATTYYGLTPDGDVHGRPGRNVLFLAKSPEAVAQQVGQPLAMVVQTLANVQEAMLHARKLRPTPFVDTTCYTHWSAMLISGLLTLALTLPEDDDTRRFQYTALRALDDLLQTARTAAGQVLHAPNVPGFLEDVAYLLQATLLAYRLTTLPTYWEAAVQLAALLIAQYEDPQAGGFLDRPRASTAAAQSEAEIALLKIPRKPAEDTPSASGNGTAILALLRLSWLMPDDEAAATRYRAAAHRALQLLMQSHARHGIYVSALATAAMEALAPPPVFKQVGQSETLEALLRQALRPHPDALVCVLPLPENEPAPYVLVCQGTRCLMPVRDAAGMEEALRQVGLTA